MKNRFLNIIIFSFLGLLTTVSYAMDSFDLSVDDEIRKNYNPDKIYIDNGLPPLPKSFNSDNNTTVKQTSTVKNVEKTTSEVAVPTTDSNVLNSAIKYESMRNYDAAQASYAMMKKGKRIKLKSTCSITDKMKKGTRLTFVSTYPVSTTYFTIPGGTQFYGEIVDVHRPQFTGNGGLIVIKINSVLFNNQVIPVTAEVRKITNSSSKHIFRNDIKGKRKYMKNMFASTQPGTRFCKKMYKSTSKHFKKGGAHLLITPFTAITGTTAWLGNAVASPFIAIFTRGDSITVPKGSIFEVQLTENLYVYK